MNGLDDILNAIGAKHISGLSMEPEKKATPPAATYQRPAYQPSAESGAPKIFPSDRFMLRSKRDDGARPARPPVMMSTYSEDDLEWMFNIKVKRGWEFTDWLEVIGLPKDLHEKHDAGIYGYAARAFLRLKQAAHRQ